MTYDVTVNAQPLSLTMLSRAYPLGLKGLVSGPIQASGTTEDMQLTMDLSGPAGRLTYSGKVDAYPLSVAARGAGRIEGLDVAQLVATGNVPRGALTGTYQVDVRGDTNDVGTLVGSASMLLERSQFDGIRIFPSRARVRFADGRMFVDTLRIESVAAAITAEGALGLTPRVSDSLKYAVTIDSVGGLRQYVSRFTSTWAQPPAGDLGPPEDSLSGSVFMEGVLRGSLRTLDVAGRVTGSKVFVRREAGRTVTGQFALSDLLGARAGTASIRIDTLDIGGAVFDTLGLSMRLDASGRGTFSASALARNGVTWAARGDLARADSGTQVVVRGVNVVTDSSEWSLRGVSNIASRGSSVSVDSLVLTNGAGGRIALSASIPDSGKAKILFRADSVGLRDIGSVAQIKAPFSGWAFVTAQGAGTSASPVANMQARLTNVRYGGIRAELLNATAEYEQKRANVALDLGSGGRTVLLARGSLPIELKYFGSRLLPDSLRGTIRTDSASFDVIEAVVPGLRDATGRLAANLDIAGTWKHPDLSGALRIDNGEVTVDPLGVRVQGVYVDLGLFGHRDSLAVRRLVGWSGTSPADSMSLQGHVTYRNVENPVLHLTLNARTFHALDKRSLARLDISTEPGGLQLDGALRGAVLTGGLVVDRGTIFLPDPALARKQTVDYSQLVDTASRQLLPTPPSKLMQSIVIEGVHVTLGDEVWLRSREANIKLGGSLNVTRASRRWRGTLSGIGTLVEADSLVPALDGQLRAERGTYSLALGPVQREFNVEGGTITFFGSSELAPELDISAIHTVRTSSENGGDIRIRVRLTGPLYPNPIVTLESAESFALSQSDLVSYLIFGQQAFALGEQNKGVVQLAAQTLLPTAQSIASSQLRDVLGPWADIVQLRLGSADVTALEGQSRQTGAALQDILYTSRVGAEKQLTDRLFVSVSTGFCQWRPENQGTSTPLSFYEELSGKIEWRLSRDAAIKAGKEPSQLVCRSTSRLVPAPTQWGLSLFKSWRF